MDLNQDKNKKSESARNLIIFFLLTVMVTWLLWAPGVIDNLRGDVPAVLLIIGLPANFVPGLVGLIMQRVNLGRDPFRRDLSEKFSLKFEKKWLLIIPLYFFATALFSYFLLLKIEPDFEPVQAVSYTMIPLVFLQMFFVGGALGEEYGWRGYAYPRLLKFLSPMIATLLLGLIWSLWHLPLFYTAGSVQSNIPLWQFMLQNTMMAYYYMWLYHRTNGNLWLMIYLHAVGNTAAAVFPAWQSETGRLIGFFVLLIGIIIIMSVDSRKNIYLKRSSD